MLNLNDRVRYVGGASMPFEMLDELGTIIQIWVNYDGEVIYLVQFDKQNEGLHNGGLYDVTGKEKSCWYIFDEQTIKPYSRKTKNKNTIQWYYTVYMNDGTKRVIQSCLTVKEFEADLQNRHIDYSSFGWTGDINIRRCEVNVRDNVTYYSR